MNTSKYIQLKNNNFSEIELKSLVDRFQDCIVCSLRFGEKITVEYINIAVVYLTLYRPEEFYENPGLLESIIYKEDLEKFRAIPLGLTKKKEHFRVCKKNGQVIQLHGNFIGNYNQGHNLESVHAILRLPDENLTAARESQVGLPADVTTVVQSYTEKLSIIGDIGMTLGETLNHADIYRRLSQSVQRLFPDTHAVFISKYSPEIKKIACIFARVDDEILDVSEFATFDLDDSPSASQSSAIIHRIPIIINDYIAHKGGIRKMGQMVGGQQGTGNIITQSVLYVPMLSQSHVIGVVQVQSTELNRFSEEDARLLAVVANTAASILQNAQIHTELLDAYNKTIAGWGYAVDLRDHETEGHCMRVTEIACKLAESMGISGEELTNIRWGAILHDIGKLGVPDSILFKSGELDESERQEIQKHTTYAYEMLQSINFMRNAIDIPYCHHERWDGSGYPRGLHGEEIPRAARIFSLADVWDALLSDRPYRKCWQKEAVKKYVKEHLGSEFDPGIGKLFLQLVENNEFFGHPLPGSVI